MSVMNDISSDDLVAVRNRLTTLSFIISVYHLFGGSIMSSDIVGESCKRIMPESYMSSAVSIKIPLTNVLFCDGSSLIFVLLALMGWWLYRYIALDSWSRFKVGFKRDITSILMRDKGTKDIVDGYVFNGSDTHPV